MATLGLFPIVLPIGKSLSHVKNVSQPTNSAVAMWIASAPLRRAGPA